MQLPNASAPSSWSSAFRISLKCWPNTLALRPICRLPVATRQSLAVCGPNGRLPKTRRLDFGLTASSAFGISPTWPPTSPGVRPGNLMVRRCCVNSSRRPSPSARSKGARGARETMPERDPTCIGRVRCVLGATITVALDCDLAGVAPIYHGRLQPVGQIGSLVRLPQGIVDLIATVSLVGIAELGGPIAPTDAVQHDERWLQVQLLGEIDRVTGRFQRGVGCYPGLDDPVHFATPDQLKSVFPHPDDTHVRVGRLAAAEEVPVSLEASRFVVRHAAIVGSTGAGKTSAVASLLQNFVNGGWRAANIVVVDPHGEYANALKDNASVRSVLAVGENRLRVPYWALAAADIVWIFAGAPGGATFGNRFTELVAKARREFVEAPKWVTLDPTAVTADTPVPFDIRPIWHQLDAENRETRTNKGDASTACRTDAGDAFKLRPAQFQAYGPGGQPPHQAPTYSTYGTSPDL